MSKIYMELNSSVTVVWCGAMTVFTSVTYMYVTYLSTLCVHTWMYTLYA